MKREFFEIFDRMRLLSHSTEGWYGISIRSMDVDRIFGFCRCIALYNFDNLNISCKIKILNITTNSGDVSWTAGGFETEWLMVVN